MIVRVFIARISSNIKKKFAILSSDIIAQQVLTVDVVIINKQQITLKQQ